MLATFVHPNHIV
ncbi:hypothetical protein VCCP1040_1403, partial [Vibrio cholerae CP1040(13)]